MFEALPDEENPYEHTPVAEEPEEKQIRHITRKARRSLGVILPAVVSIGFFVAGADKAVKTNFFDDKISSDINKISIALAALCGTASAFIALAAYKTKTDELVEQELRVLRKKIRKESNGLDRRDHGSTPV